MRTHLNEHCWGFRLGSVPDDYLQTHQLTHCSFCHGLIHARYHNLCPSCRPLDAARRRAEELQAQLSAPSPQPSQGPSTHTRPPPPSLDDIHKRYVPTLRHIPKELRKQWARCLSRAIALCVWHNNTDSWRELQMLTKCVLCSPYRGGKSHKNQRLAWTRARLTRWLQGERDELWHDLPNYSPPRNKRVSEQAEEAKKHQRCITLTQEGGFSAACKTLSKGAPLGHTTTVKNQLQEKHPANPSQPNLNSTSPPSNHLTPAPDADAVDRAIRSFHRLSSGGPSAFRPGHLQEALKTELRDELLEHTTSLVRLLVRGDAPRELAPHLAGATLTALPKKDGGVRPVAVGETWRRLAAKCLCFEARESVANFFFPLQIGVAQPLGTEVGFRVARQWCQRNKNNSSAVFVKVDFANAFNTVDRQAFLTQCRQHFPGLAPWAEWCYQQPSHLRFGPHTISSESGVQQGDPLGPLLFSLALQPVLRELHAERTDGGLQLVFSYLDDCCLAGEQTAVAAALSTLKTRSEDIGLILNTDKCELIPTAGTSSTVDRRLFPADMMYKSDANFELLGGPVGCADFCNEHTKERVDKATKLLKKLGEVPDPMVALLLLRHCASFGKLVYSARLVPHLHHATALASFDTAVRECFESFMCTSFDSSAWALSTLSTQLSGLGLRQVSEHSCASFLASTAASVHLCQQLDGRYKVDFAAPDSPEALALTSYNSLVAPNKQLNAHDLNNNCADNERTTTNTNNPGTNNNLDSSSTFDSTNNAGGNHNGNASNSNIGPDTVNQTTNTNNPGTSDSTDNSTTNSRADSPGNSSNSSKAPSQRALSADIDAHKLQALKDAAAADNDTARIAHLMLTGAPNAGQWIHALPSPSCRHNVDPCLFKTMIQRWVRSPIFEKEFVCPLCDGVMDIYGDHCLVCSGGGDRSRRHNLLRNKVFHLCASAGLSPELEKPGLLQPRPLQGSLSENGTHHSDARRPADVYIPRWRLGLPAAFDFAVTSGLRADVVTESTQDPSAAVSAYETFKRCHHNTELDCQAQGINFAPLVVEAVGGGWGACATKMFYELAKVKASTSGELKNTTLRQLHQSLGIILHRENARAVHRRSVRHYNHHGLLSAAATLQASD